MIDRVELERVSRGMYANSYTVFVASNSRKLADAVKMLEETYKRDYIEFAHKFRGVMEEFAITEAIRIRQKSINDADYEWKRLEAIKQLKSDGYVDFLTDTCIESSNCQTIISRIKGMNHEKEHDGDDRDYIFEFWRDCFSFGSSNSHAGVSNKKKIADKCNCRDYFKRFLAVIYSYYGKDFCFDGKNLPFMQYYPVPNNILAKNGIYLPKNSRLYVKNLNDQIEIYLFIEITSTRHNEERRNIETLQHLWIDDLEYPQNVIPNARFESHYNKEDFKTWIIPLPGIPIGMYDDKIRELENDEKIVIAKGIIRGVMSLHKAETPYYHRNITPKSILIFRNKSKYRALLLDFELSKNTSDDSSYTVFSSVIENAKNNENVFVAPELRGNITDAIDWGAADIFSLGILLLFLYTGSENTDAMLNGNYPEGLYDAILGMTQNNPKDRVDIDFVNDLFQEMD